MTTDVLIQVQDLKKHFTGTSAIKALDGVSVDIKKGEVVVVIGPSGSGKSTFLRCLNLLEVPTGGQILFNGVDITDKSCNINLHRQKMGMVFQHFNLFPHMTILRNMTLAPVKLLHKSQEEADALVRTLQTGKPLLLLDEPFGALDAITRLHLQALLTEVATKKRLTILFVTHDVDEALLLSDAILVMGTAPGRILRQYTLEEPRPRTMRVLSQPEFIRVKGEILTLLDKEVTADA